MQGYHSKVLRYSFGEIFKSLASWKFEKIWVLRVQMQFDIEKKFEDLPEKDLKTSLNIKQIIIRKIIK